MAVKKAILALDTLIENKQKFKTNILRPEVLGESDEPVIQSLRRTMTKILDSDVEWLQAIKRQILPDQHRTKIVCRHPKKDHDICDGQKYCMNCNANL
jgi:hypothetical protein